MTEITVDCNLVVSIAKVESNLNPYAKGTSHGEIGLFQLRPEFHSNCGNLWDRRVNTMCAIRYLQFLKKKFYEEHGNCYITYYNVGPYSGVKWPCKHKYYKKVMRRYKQ